MNDHDYWCECSECEYYKALSQAQAAHRRAKEEEFAFLYGRRGTAPSQDPFPPVRNQIASTGEYRRIRDRAKDTLLFQYRPWPDADWKTYHIIAMEQIPRISNPRSMLRSILTEAAQYLKEERFYKVERIDETAST